MSAAMLPPAPPLFSTTTVWPHTSCRRLETSRAVMSVEPPGVNGTTTRTGFAGQSAAEARRDNAGAASTAALAPRKRRRFSMGSSRCGRPIVSGHVLPEVWRAVPVKSMRRRKYASRAGLAGLVVVILAGNGVRAGQPAIEIDIPAALGAERF